VLKKTLRCVSEFFFGGKGIFLYSLILAWLIFVIRTNILSEFSVTKVSILLPDVLRETINNI